MDRLKIVSNVRFARGSKLIAAAAFIALVASCSATRKAGLSEADATRGAAKYPGYTLDMLKKDKAIYREKCGACHAAKSPDFVPTDKWQGVVTAMVQKAAKSADKKISATEQTAIMRYLTTMSSK